MEDLKVAKENIIHLNLYNDDDFFYAYKVMKSLIDIISEQSCKKIKRRNEIRQPLINGIDTIYKFNGYKLA